MYLPHDSTTRTSQGAYLTYLAKLAVGVLVAIGAQAHLFSLRLYILQFSGASHTHSGCYLRVQHGCIIPGRWSEQVLGHASLFLFDLSYSTFWGQSQLSYLISEPADCFQQLCYNDLLCTIRTEQHSQALPPPAYTYTYLYPAALADVSLTYLPTVRR
jgi:hypothetical protein